MNNTALQRGGLQLLKHKQHNVEAEATKLREADYKHKKTLDKVLMLVFFIGLIMSTNQQYNPEVDLTIFPRVNFYKTFATRFDARANNGRIFGAKASTTVLLAEVDSSLSELTDGEFTGTTALWSGGASPSYSYNWSFLASGASAPVYLGDWVTYNGTATDVVFDPTSMGGYRFVCRAANSDSNVYYYSYSATKYIGN